MRAFDSIIRSREIAALVWIPGQSEGQREFNPIRPPLSKGIR
jgi:hypothetical protein